MDDTDFVTALYAAMLAEAQQTLDLCLGLAGEKRRQLVRATMYYFLTDYYGWTEYRVAQSFVGCPDDNVGLIKRGALAAKGQVNGGKYKTFCDNLLAYVDGAFYLEGDKWRMV